MVKHIFAAAFVTLSTLAAAPPVRTMYTDAMAKELAVRKALADADASEAILKAVRESIATYEAVVRRYPASSYSDNALWQAAKLAVDAYARFNQPSEKDAAARLFRRLAASYPASRLVKQIPPAFLSADASPAPGPAAAVVSPAAPSTAPAPGSIATIKTIRRSVLPDAVRVVIELDAEVSFHQERIPDPSRVFVDLPGTRAAAALVDQTLRFESDADVVRQVRIGRHPNSTTRVVLDAAGVSSYSVYPLYDPYRLVIDCVRATPATTTMSPTTTSPTTSGSSTMAITAVAATTPAAVPPAPKPTPKVAPPAVAKREPAPLSARPATAVVLRSAPSNSPRHAALLAEAREPNADPPVVAPPPVTPMMSGPSALPTTPAPAATPAPPPSRNTTGGLSIARQLGLGVSRIVIDPGHGGHDSGARGRGVVESELVLDVALRVEKLLQKVPGVDVILTRRTDDFIELPERTAMANREGADLFLSIHANASTSAVAHGIETYYLNFATNLSAAAVAARENANSTQAMGALPDFVKAIALNTKVDESRDLANHVQAAMVETLRPANKVVKDLGVKQAPFVVLIGAVMPSVLAEISFVTNPQEARLLKNNAYREKIAEALFAAIRKYQMALKSTTTVATQR